MEGDARTLKGALDGDLKAIRALVDRFSTVIQARAARILYGRFRNERDLAEEVADAAQEVLSGLFADQGRVLRTWDAGRGLSLDNFVGLVTERQIISSLRAGSRVAARERSATDDELYAHAGAESGPESELSRRLLFDAVVARVESELTPQGLRLFQLVFVEDRSIESISEEVGLSVDAVYAWRSRLLKAVRRVSEEIQAGTSGPGEILRTSAERAPK